MTNNSPLSLRAREISEVHDEILCTAGVEFIAENGGGAGVRLTKPRGSNARDA